MASRLGVVSKATAVRAAGCELIRTCKALMSTRANDGTINKRYEGGKICYSLVLGNSGFLCQKCSDLVHSSVLAQIGF